MSPSQPVDPVDPTALTEWAQGRLPGTGTVQVSVLGEGHSNLTFLLRRPGTAAQWVLRRPPVGPLLPTAHDVVREFRVLSLLRDASPPVRIPAVVDVCEDLSVIGAPFYVMEHTPGTVVRDRLPPWLEHDPSACHRLGVDLADTLAEIHSVDWSRFVEAGIGRPGGYLERQLRRWSGQREGIQQSVAAAGGRARELPDYDLVRDWLRANLPEDTDPALVHGDFKLDNVIVTRGGDSAGDGPAVAVVVDWRWPPWATPAPTWATCCPFGPSRGWRR